MMDFTWDQGTLRWLGLAWLVMSWWTGFYCWRIAAENRPVDASCKGNELFNLAWWMFYKGGAGVEQVQERLIAAWAVYELLPEGYEKYYGWAQIEYLRAEMLEVAGDQAGAVESFAQAKVYHKTAEVYIQKFRENSSMNGWQLPIRNQRAKRRHSENSDMLWPFLPSGGKRILKKSRSLYYNLVK